MADGLNSKTIAGLLILIFTIGGTAYYLIDSLQVPDYRDCKVGSTYDKWQNLTAIYEFNATWNAVGKYSCPLNNEEKWCRKLSVSKQRCYLLDQITPQDMRAFLDINLYEGCRNVTSQYNYTWQVNNPYVCNTQIHSYWRVCPAQNLTCTQFNSTDSKYYEQIIRTNYIWCDNITTKWETGYSTYCKDYSWMVFDFAGVYSFKLNQSAKDYKCSKQDFKIVCDSKSDGNGDGICQSGEHCMQISFNKTGLKIEKLNTIYKFDCNRRIKTIGQKDIVMDICTDLNLNKQMVMPFE